MATSTNIQTHIDWDNAYATYGNQLARFEEFVASFEQEHRIQLTPGAVELIFVPLIEILEAGQAIDEAVVAETFRKLVQTIATEPDKRDRAKGIRSSLSVIRAFWKNFCDIPPLCTATEQAEATSEKGGPK
jgi:hypothetical protein